MLTRKSLDKVVLRVKMGEFACVELLDVIVNGVEDFDLELGSLLNLDEEQLELVNKDNEDVTLIGRVGDKETLQGFDLLMHRQGVLKLKASMGYCEELEH